MKKSVQTWAILLCSIATAGVSADGQTGSMVIEGGVSPEFIKDFVVDGNFQIPAVLYFDSTGCLAWSAFGPEVDHRQELQKVLAEPMPSCRKPALPEVLQILRTSGLPLKAAAVLRRPALIWYGSDSICQSCAVIRQTSWPELIELVSGTTTKLLLELK